jgi:hypothetical protein
MMINSLSPINIMTRPNRPTNAARPTNPRFSGETESVTVDLNNPPKKRAEAFLQMIKNQDIQALKEAIPQGFILLQPPDHKSVYYAGMKSGNLEIQTMMASLIDYLEEKDKPSAFVEASHTGNPTVKAAAAKSIYWATFPQSFISALQATDKARESAAAAQA